MDLHTLITQHADKIPFMALAVNGEERPKFSSVRIVEAVIIAIITACGSGYVTLQVLQSKQENVVARMIDIQQNVRDMQAKVYDLAGSVARLQGEVEKKQ